MQLIGVTQAKLHALFRKCRELAIEGEMAQRMLYKVTCLHTIILLQALQ